MKNENQGKKNESTQRKRDTYKKIVGFLPEAIVLVSGGIVKETRKDGIARYRSTKINEGDFFGILWGEARVLAVAELATYFPQATIIITSVPVHNRKSATLEIYEDLEQFSFIKNKIILESISTNTLSQIGEAMKIIHKNKIKKVVFVTNGYHIPRIGAMYENFETLESPNKKTKRIVRKIKCSGIRAGFVAAEAILPHRDKKFIKIINRMKKSIPYQHRIQNEEHGLSMIKNGEYGKKEVANIDKSERVI